MRLDEITAQATTDSTGNRLIGGYDRVQKTGGLAYLNSERAKNRSLDWMKGEPHHLSSLVNDDKYSQIATHILHYVEGAKSSDKVYAQKTVGSRPKYRIEHKGKYYQLDRAGKYGRIIDYGKEDEN